MSFLNTLIPSLGRTEAPGEGNGHPTRRPRYEVTEAEDAYKLTVFLPGVAKDGLEITAENGKLRITGKRVSKLAPGAVTLHRETSDAPFALVLELDTSVDPEKIGAELTDGILRLSLAKSESAKPRKIAVG